MKKYAILIILSLSILTVNAEVADSVGTKVKNGTVYILHKVEKGQGLYSISKRYGVSLAELISENPGSESVIKIDQLIWVPTDRPVKLEEPVVEDYFDRTVGETEELPEPIETVDLPQEVETATEEEVEETETYAKYHTVSSGETLYAIAAKYNTTVKVIKDLNGLTSDMLAIGQKLLVPSPRTETVVEISDDPDVEEVVEQPQGDYAMDVEQEKEELQVEVETMPEPEDPEIVVEGYSIKITRLEEYDLEQVEETGMYALAGESIPESRYWAGHFNAPIGTVILLTNPTNGKNVFVKVVENFERASESAVILHVSKIAMESIGLEEGQSVQLSYAR